MTRLNRLLFTVAALLVSGSAFSQTSAGVSNHVTATITQTCTIISGSGVTFGNYASTGANATDALDAQSTISVWCTKGSAGVSAQLMAGTATNATCNSSDNYRAMKYNSSTLTYKLYSDAQRTKEWGCDASNWQLYNTFTGTTAGVDKIIYGRIPANQYVTPGSYSDTVEFRVTF